MIEAKNIAFEVKGKYILKPVDFKTDQEEFIVILGPNGAGKSTLLRLLSGVLEPESGAMYVTDNYMNRLNEDTYRAQAGTYLQGDTLFAGTIRENILFGNDTLNNETNSIKEQERMGNNQGTGDKRGTKLEFTN